jgi:cytosine/adenosine deaminase-related metal-dependent hydrolase
MEGIVIRNGVVLTMNRTREVIENGIVVIKGSRILSVQAEDPLKQYPGFKVIDADGGIIMPGLINTHSHLPMIAFRGLAEDGVKDRLFNFFLPLEKNMLSRELIYNATIHGAIEFAMGGITTYADMYYKISCSGCTRTSRGTGIRYGFYQGIQG